MLAKFSVKKPLTILVAVVVIIVFGVISVSKMTPDLFPSIEAPYVLVMTTYPGASPEEAETEITNPMEQQLAAMANLEGINSVSGDNYSLIQMKFADDVNMDTVTVDLSEKIDQIKGTLPEMASSPVVLKMSMDMMPTVITAVEMGSKSEGEISQIVKDDLMTPLKGVDGVASVSAMGLVDSSIQIVLSEDKIEKVNDKVSSAISKEFNKAQNQVNKGLKETKKAKKQIEKGKDGVTQAAHSYAELEDAKEQLKTEKAKLENLKNQYDANKDNPLQAEQILQQIRDAGFEPETLSYGITAMDNQIARIDDTLKNFGDKESEISFNLSKQYSDLASAETTINSTIEKLKESSETIKTQRDAAIANADLKGVLTMDNISSILNAQNFSMPAGYVSEGDSKILVSVGDKIRDKDELEQLVLFDPGIDGVDPVRLCDVATVTYGAGDSQTYTKVNGKNGVCLSFTKQSNYATATAAENINEKFASLEKEYDGLHFVNLYDGGEYIHIVINSVLKSLLLGAVLAMLILFFFLRDIRPTIITAVSIPLSVLFALVMMYFTGVTLNMVSMAGLAIGIGMLVDNSIVVVENIFRLRSLGYSRVQAAVSGAVQVSGAIIASTLTTVCVFLPIIFISGTTKDIFMDVALTVSYSLGASLIIAMTLVPAMAKALLKGDGTNAILKQDGKVINRYRNAAGWALDHKKITIIAALVLFVGSCGLAVSKGFEFMPSMSTPQISGSVQMPEGSKLEDTSKACDEISDEICKVDGVDDVGFMLSSSTMSMLNMEDAGTDVTNVSFYIIMDESKLDNIDKITKRLDVMEKKYQCEIMTSADMDMTSAMGGSDVSMTLYSEDLDKLRIAASNVEDEMRGMKELEEVSDVTEDSAKELHIVVNKNKAMKEGLTVAQVYQNISSVLAEEKTSTSLKTTKSTVDVVVENTTKDSITRKDLENLKLEVTDAASDEKRKIKLAEIASINTDASLDEINHNDQKRSLTVTASVKDGYNITKTSEKVQKAIKDKGIVGADVTLENGGQYEEIMKSMKNMLLMLLVGFLLIYLVMVAQFQSLRAPLIIIFTVPLAFTGGMLGLLITGQTVSVISMMGFVMLMGIVVNNGIVLVDCINRFRLEGMGMEEAIINAGSVRMRPVIMTAATTILGLAPLAAGLGTGAEMMQPVAIVCMGGLIYSTVTTLLIIPIMYRIFAKKTVNKIEEEELEIVSA